MEARSCRYGWDEDWLRNSVESAHRCFKLLRGQEICGYCVVQIVGDQLELLNILIAKEYQGKGFGYYLLQQILNRQEFSEITDIWLEVRSGNLLAQGLYKRLGFSVVGKRAGYYSQQEDAEDALIMRRQTRTDRQQ